MDKNKINITLIVVLLLVSFTMKAQIFSEDTLSFCRVDSVALDAGDSYVSYLWSTGETTQIIWAKRTALYKVHATDASQQIVKDSIYVDLNRSRMAQSDTTLCYNADFELYVDYTEPYCLVGNYLFDNGNMSDESGYENHGASALSFSKMTDRNGNENMALYFTPSTISPPSLSCIQIGYDATMDISNSFTLHCWVKPDTIYGNFAFDDVYYLINKWKPTSKSLEDCSFLLALNKNGDMIFSTSDGSQQQDFVVSYDAVAAVKPGRWTMLDVVCSLDKLSMYIDAQLVLEQEITVFPQIIEGVDVYLGAGYSLLNHNYQGGLDDLRYYTCDLSQTEINNLFQYNSTYNYSYLWSTNETTRSITITPTEETQYTVEVYNNIGSCSDTVNIAVYPEITIELTQEKKGCPGSSEGILVARVNGGVPYQNDTLLPYEYVWPTGYTSLDSVMYKLPEGEYNVTITDSVGCILSKSKKIETYPKLDITITAEPEKLYPQNPVVSLSTEVGCDTCYVFDYKWEFGDGKTSTDVLATHTFDFEADTITQFVITNIQTYEDECVDSATFTLPVAKTELIIPNVFTPNGDGSNETFEIKVADDEEKSLTDIFISNTLSIYNRQGKLVYSKNDYAGYPGEFDGKNLSDGVYFYVLKCKGAKKNEVYEGYVHIFRHALKE